MHPMLEHPDIACAQATGYPSWKQEINRGDDDYEAYDEDAAYEEYRDLKRFGGDDFGE